VTASEKKKWYKRALVVGAALGFVCRAVLPPEHRPVCDVVDLVINVCGG